MASSPISPAATSTSSGIGGGLSFSAYGHGNNASVSSSGTAFGRNGGDDRRGNNTASGIGLGRPGMKPSLSMSDNFGRSQAGQNAYPSSNGYGSSSQAPIRKNSSSRPIMAQHSASDYPREGSSSSMSNNLARPGQGGRSISAATAYSAGNGSSRPYQEHSRQRSRGGSEGPHISTSSSMPLSHQRGADEIARDTARLHWRSLRSYLREYLQAEAPGARASAREKLTRLTKSQFQELSTDVYDELVRREDVEAGRGDENPFLPVRTDFHPKRNQARQKLATLPKNRFKDLASDVFYELNRRFPDFDREMAPPELSAPAFPQSVSGESPMSAYPPTAASPATQKQLPSQEARKVPLQPSNEIVVPKKSTIAEEVIEVPFAKQSDGVFSDGDTSPEIDQRASRGTDMLEGETRRRSKRLSNQGRRANEYEETLESSNSDKEDEQQSQAIKRRLLSADGHGQDYLQPSNQRKTSPTPSGESVEHAGQGGSASGTLDLIRERKLRTDLEAKLAGMERRLASMQREVDGSTKREEWERNRARELEDEVRNHKERTGTLAENVRSLQRDLETAKAFYDKEHKQSEGRRKEEQAELTMWKERCHEMEDELKQQREQLRNAASQRSQAENDDAVRDLRNELTVLMEELSSLAIRNEELLADREEEAAVIRRLDGEVQEYKRRWEAAKTDLRNLKATSMMFVSRPATQDHMPASPDGNIADIHVTEFQSAIDSLLQAARSSQPSSVLSAMKEVVVAISEISEDVKAFEKEPNFQVDQTRLESLKHQSSSTLNNLMSAARSHATSSGLSPISLIDAAAGHVSANVVDLIKLLKIRRTAKPSGPGPSEGRRSFSEMSEARRRSSGAVQTLQGASTEQSSNRESIISSDEASDNGLLSPNRALHHAEQFPAGMHTLAPSASPKPSPGNSPQRQARSGSAVSLASSMGRSDAFDLERKASIAGLKANLHSGIPNEGPNARRTINNTHDADPVETVVPDQLPLLGRRPRLASAGSEVAPRNDNSSRSEFSTNTESSATPMETAPSSFAHQPAPSKEEWEKAKLYLSGQSSALVNAIQQLLAEIRNGSNPGASNNSNSRLSECLSQVIVVSSSIVSVTASAMPPQHAAEGQPLLDDMMRATERLSLHQNSTDFSKEVRQAIASAAFGMAKSLRALMKLNG